MIKKVYTDIYGLHIIVDAPMATNEYPLLRIHGESTQLGRDAWEELKRDIDSLINFQSRKGGPS